MSFLLEPHTGSKNKIIIDLPNYATKSGLT